MHEIWVLLLGNMEHKAQRMMVRETSPGCIQLNRSLSMGGGGGSNNYIILIYLSVFARKNQTFQSRCQCDVFGLKVRKVPVLVAGTCSYFCVTCSFVQ